jgi:hypothetical protein
MGYDETHWRHQYARNMAVVSAYCGILAALLYFGPQSLALDQGRTGYAQSYHGGGRNVTCGRAPVTESGCSTGHGTVHWTQDEWIAKVTSDHDTLIVDAWVAVGGILGGGVVLYSVEQADAARKRREADAGARARSTVTS